MTRPIQEVLSVEAVREAAKAFPEVRIRPGVWAMDDDATEGRWCACPAALMAHKAGVRLEDIDAAARKGELISEALGVTEIALLAFTSGVDAAGAPFFLVDLEAARQHGLAVREALGLGKDGK